MPSPDTGTPRGAVGRYLREPLVQFTLVGGGLFALYAALRPPEQPATEVALGGREVPREVIVGPKELEQQRASFRAAWKREPSATELGDLIEGYISEEMLYREGSALGLDRDDAVVRRRVIEKATALARPSAPAVEPDPAELERWYQLYPHRFRQPASLDLQQLYFDARKRPDPEAAARQALTKLSAGAAGPEAPSGVGDEFVLPTALGDRTETQVAHLFGADFARAVAAAPIGAWHGPVRSNYGVHLVRVSRRQPARLPPFAEAVKHVRADWLTAQNRGLRAAALGLLPRFKLTIDPGVRQAVSGAPALAPFLERAR